jgi:hypothetical protein
LNDSAGQKSNMLNTISSQQTWTQKQDEWAARKNEKQRRDMTRLGDTQKGRNSTSISDSNHQPSKNRQKL